MDDEAFLSPCLAETILSIAKRKGHPKNIIFAPTNTFLGWQHEKAFICWLNGCLRPSVESFLHRAVTRIVGLIFYISKTCHETLRVFQCCSHGQSLWFVVNFEPWATCVRAVHEHSFCSNSNSSWISPWPCWSAQSIKTHFECWVAIACAKSKHWCCLSGWEDGQWTPHVACMRVCVGVCYSSGLMQHLTQ